MVKLLFPTADCGDGLPGRATLGEHSTSPVAATTAGRRWNTAADPAGLAQVLSLLGAARATLQVDVEATRESLGRAIALLEYRMAAGPQRLANRRRVRGGLARWQVVRIIAYVDANLGSSIRASDLAGLVRLSASHFFHAFKDSFAETPLAYVARRRMALARDLMLTTDQPLAQVALACGLCDQSHFTRVFRRVVGMSPHAWRCEHAGSHTRRSRANYGSSAVVVPQVTSAAA